MSRRNLFFSASMLMMPPLVCCLRKRLAMSLCSCSRAGLRVNSGCRACSLGGGWSWPPEISDRDSGRRHTGQPTLSGDSGFSCAGLSLASCSLAICPRAWLT
uniref:Putative secreted protein n=1 Tax=Ixodes ricinus TaxID=34613 RepID=A0A6B0U9H4_IXORI